MKHERRPDGAEALLRWNHPEYGLMEPRHFIGVAEETGLIHVIGDYVLSNVCTYIRKWSPGKSAHSAATGHQRQPVATGHRGVLTQNQARHRSGRHQSLAVDAGNH